MSSVSTPSTNSGTPSTLDKESHQGHIKVTSGMRLFALWFRRGNLKPEMMVFEYNGNLPEAIKRSQVHCTKMDYRFCGCYPFVVNLDLREKYREENRELEETF